MKIFLHSNQNSKLLPENKNLKQCAETAASPVSNCSVVKSKNRINLLPELYLKLEKKQISWSQMERASGLPLEDT